MSERHAGVNIPLFSIRSRASWGIGELTAIVPMAGWLARAGFDRLMVLPLGTMQHGQTSPYAAVSTLAIDPVYVAIEGIPDFARAGGVAALSSEGRRALDLARQANRVRHDEVRRAKGEALGLAFAAFVADEWDRSTERGAALAAYIAREHWWLDDYALFQAISHSQVRAFWREWPIPLRDREVPALDDARHRLGREVLQHQYTQWVAETQWQQARTEARTAGVHVVGDLPFVAGADSPEVWARADEFRLDVSAGVPPDAFSATGQDWGLPMYRWEAIAAGGYAWMRQRARRMAALFDGIRVDHVVGLYRTYGRPSEGEPFFSPADEAAQTAQGEAVLRILLETGLTLIAEDLGVVPDFVRASLAGLGVPGCKVLRWERDWDQPAAPFLDPAAFPARSVAMTGTHDTEPLAAWWDACTLQDRTAMLALGSLAWRDVTDPAQPWSLALRDALIDLALRAGSDDVFLPIQDLFGWPDRINTPGTVGEDNWTWSLPWPVEELFVRPEAAARAGFLRALTAGVGRGA